MEAFEVFDFSGGVQTRVSRLLKKQNELDSAINVEPTEIGSLSKRKGYTQKGSDLASTSSTSTSTSSTSTSSTSTSTSSSTSTSTSTTA